MNRAMTRLAAFVTVVLGGCTLASAQLPPPPVEVQTRQTLGNKGQIQFDKTTHDWGNIWDHETVSYDFVFRNVGSEPLTVLDIKSTCGCTVPELTKKRYEPGEEGKMTVLFNPQNRSNAQRKSVTVTTDSALTPEVQLTLASFVTKVLDLQPGIANLGRIYKNEEKGMTVYVVGSNPDFKAWPAEEQPEGSPFKIELIEDGTPPADVGENGWNVFRVWVDPGLVVGRHQGEVLLKTNDERRPEVQVRGIVTVVGDLQARPPRFALGRLTPGESYESTMTLVNRVAEEFKITRVEVAGEAQDVEVTFKPTNDGKLDAYDITVRGVAPTSSERVLGRVIVYTDMEAEPSFEVPVYGFVTAPADDPAVTTTRNNAGG